MSVHSANAFTALQRLFNQQLRQWYLHRAEMTQFYLWDPPGLLFGRDGSGMAPALEQWYFREGEECYLDIGCGDAEFALHHALHNPDQNWIAIDNDYRRVFNALHKCCRAFQVHPDALVRFPNVRILCADAFCLHRLIPEKLVRAAYVNYPSTDKETERTRHPLRTLQSRLIRTKFLKSLAATMMDNAELHIVTDSEFLTYDVLSTIRRQSPPLFYSCLPYPHYATQLDPSYGLPIKGRDTKQFFNANTFRYRDRRIAIHETDRSADEKVREADERIADGDRLQELNLTDEEAAELARLRRVTMWDYTEEELKAKEAAKQKRLKEQEDEAAANRDGTTTDSKEKGFYLPQLIAAPPLPNDSSRILLHQHQFMRYYGSYHDGFAAGPPPSIFDSLKVVRAHEMERVDGAKRDLALPSVEEVAKRLQARIECDIDEEEAMQEEGPKVFYMKFGRLPDVLPNAGLRKAVVSGGHRDVMRRQQIDM
ncbi:unnamed protein product [Vitrella brassicaformis CCMP3155]|uniref:tRNA (guanine(46)-N(7))-methyltransferase n=2 Tax=Vitrella brassicaformis TaxID=1169539 RepID=A0A0G4ETI3_VITBC|nr:unnamed protein product [Vitrella brassicaformis CCMP3155]|eukprot:CEM01754.1 unnamed protein product [Vitrella brassicaformis CCMP3155]